MKRFPLIAALLLLPLAGGCSFFQRNDGQPMSMAARLHLARQTYNEVGPIAAQLAERGVVKDKATKDAIFFASEEAVAGLKDAKLKIAAGDKVGFDFVMKRVASALDRLAQINAQHQASDPSSRGAPWIPPRSRPLSFRALQPSPGSALLTSAPQRATNPPPRTSPPSRPRMRQCAPA